MPSKKSARPAQPAGTISQPPRYLIPDEEHPDYLNGIISESDEDNTQDQQLAKAIASDDAYSGSRASLLQSNEARHTTSTGAARYCGPVSGRYTHTPIAPAESNSNLPTGVIPNNMLNITVRVDVDRYYPQNRISIEVARLFPKATAHVIGEVISDECLGINRRKVVASITYRNGSRSLITGDKIVFEAKRGKGHRYAKYQLTLSGGDSVKRKYDLQFQSRYFDPVEFEVDRVANASVSAVVTSYDTGSHPNRPATITAETISISTVYQRAGFDVSLSPNTSVIPNAEAGTNGKWSDSEMHNAMVTYWSRFLNRPQWAMWVLFAKQHNEGPDLGGIMFDDIGPNHRQGTAIFTNSFIQDAPTGDLDPAAWRNRMTFWTTVHEMGHAFNLAHSWDKALGIAEGNAGDPWIPLVNEPEARSFMNYPYYVEGEEPAFFADFHFRFTDNELMFMRHAPRRYVQMGNSDWFVNHAFEAPDPLRNSRQFSLIIRANRTQNAFSFLEPVVMEIKLINVSLGIKEIDDDLLSDGRHLTVYLQREGGMVKEWRPMLTRCHKPHKRILKPGESAYASHTISFCPSGWIIDEPGFYKVQTAINMGTEILVSNVLRLFVGLPQSKAENLVAPDYFTEDVGRAIFFEGVPELTKAMDTLEEVIKTIPDNPAALHASLATTSPLLRDYKYLGIGADRTSMALRCTKADVDTASKKQVETLVKAPDKAAETLGHIDYFNALDRLSKVLTDAGRDKEAKMVTRNSVNTMKKRKVLSTVVEAEERKLSRMK